MTADLFHFSEDDISDSIDTERDYLSDLHDDGRQAHEADELAHHLEEALREALTRGVNMEAMKWLCFGCGIPLASVQGESK